VLPALPEFRPRWPWLGADLQTLRNSVRPPPRSLERFASERIRIPLNDGSGDALWCTLQQPQTACGRPLVLLVHGLGGCEDSVYLQRSAEHFLAHGHPVLRLNLRGAGPSRPQCAQQYHAGRSADLHAALAGLDARWSAHGVVAIGFSLGGNLLLKALGEWGADAPLLAAVSVSASIDLAASCRRIMAARNAIYHRYLLRRMRQQAIGAPLIRSLYEFDHRVVAPRNGFASADDYYARCSATSFLGGIRIPTLLIHALDDPWIPAAIYTRIDWSRHSALTPLLPRGGGHVGFHARDAEAAWHDRAALQFFSALGGW
jgi:predicted alpha/beta-fold hydrolase